jgi:plastocyanin
MSRTKKRVAFTVVVTVLLGVALAATLPRVASSASGGAREIHLVARDMAYYLDGQGEPNPTLVVRRGEQVRILLRNLDPGMSHDFGIRAWKKGTGVINGLGEAAFELRAPRKAGDETYACTPHGEMMRGTIRVE